VVERVRVQKVFDAEANGLMAVNDPSIVKHPAGPTDIRYVVFGQGPLS
jgi:hypothetical protein